MRTTIEDEVSVFFFCFFPEGSEEAPPTPSTPPQLQFFFLRVLFYTPAH